MIERRSDKVNPRHDEQLEQRSQPIVRGAPVESRRDDRAAEPPADGERWPEPGRRPLTAERDADGLSIDERLERADFARWFLPSDFPATSADLAALAHERGVPAWVRDMAAAHGSDEAYGSPGEAFDAIVHRDTPPNAPEE